LRKKVNLRWVPHFFKKNRTLHIIQNKTSHFNNNKMNLKQWGQLQIHTRPIYTTRLFVTTRRYKTSKELVFTKNFLHHFKKKSARKKQYQLKHIKFNFVKPRKFKKKTKSKLRIVPILRKRVQSFRNKKYRTMVSLSKYRKQKNSKFKINKSVKIKNSATKFIHAVKCLKLLRHINKKVLKSPTTIQTVRPRVKKHVRKKVKTSKRYLSKVKSSKLNIVRIYTKTRLLKTSQKFSHKFRARFNSKLLRKKKLRSGLWGPKKLRYRAVAKRLWNARSQRKQKNKKKVFRQKKSLVYFAKKTFLDIKSFINKKTHNLVSSDKIKSLLQNKMSIGNARPLDSIIKMRLCSRINKPFIMNSSIMFFTKILYPIQRKPYTYKYIFKKNFSRLYFQMRFVTRY
jgi:hypothetical protein